MRKIDITGEKYHKLTAINREGIDKFGMSRWRCRCDCGNEVVVNLSNLRRGNSRSCGCSSKGPRLHLRGRQNLKNRKNITGRMFGRLLAIRHEGKNNSGMSLWLCRCLCGKEARVSIGNLTSGHTKSCGCFIKDSAKEVGLRTAHNLAGMLFGRLTVLGREVIVADKPRWRCRCVCGNEVIIRASCLVNGSTKSCGCAATDNARKQSINRIKDISGKRFHRLLVTKFFGRIKGESIFICACDCGKIVKTSSHSLLRGSTRSCGCYNSDRASERFSRRIGPANPAWNPELSEEDRSRKRKYQWKWKSACLKRDNHTCQISGVRGVPLAVHHIDGYDIDKSKRIDVSNGITMSAELHNLFHKTYGYKNSTRYKLDLFVKECQRRQKELCQH